MNEQNAATDEFAGDVILGLGLTYDFFNQAEDSFTSIGNVGAILIKDNGYGTISSTTVFDNTYEHIVLARFPYMPRFEISEDNPKEWDEPTTEEMEESIKQSTKEILSKMEEEEKKEQVKDEGSNINIVDDLDVNEADTNQETDQEGSNLEDQDESDN